MSTTTQWLIEHREAVAGLAVVAAAALAIPLGARFDEPMRRLGHWCEAERAAPWILAFATFVVVATVAFLRPPLPAVHDEFSYLLGADTFAHGRLANHTPPMPEHFETFHVLVEPTYSTKYPPGQSLVLALGQVLFGHAIAGIWLGAAAFAASLWWALRARVGPHVALVWSVLGVLRFTSTGYWAQSYWGGALAATGGALALGAALRLIDRPRVASAIWLAVGSGILAMTRPYEGLVACAVLHVAVVVGCLQRRAVPLRAVVARPVLAWSAVLAVFLGSLATYNHAVTGSATTLPYEVHEQRYAAAPNFLIEEPIARPQYRHPELERFWGGWVLAEYERRRELSWRAVALEKLRLFAPFYVGWSWLPFLIAGLLAARAGLLRVLIVAGGCAILVESFDHRHYAAPFTAVVVLVCALGSQAASLSREPRVRAAAAAAVLVVLFATAAQAIVEYYSWRPSWPAQRAQLIGELEALPGADVVFVRTDYSALDQAARRHWENIEWVFNGADLDSQDVVFARDLGEDSDRRLAAALKGRRGWLLELPAGLATGRAFDGLRPLVLGEAPPTASDSAR